MRQMCPGWLTIQIIPCAMWLVKVSWLEGLLRAGLRRTGLKSRCWAIQSQHRLFTATQHRLFTAVRKVKELADMSELR